MPTTREFARAQVRSHPYARRCAIRTRDALSTTALIPSGHNLQFIQERITITNVIATVIAITMTQTRLLAKSKRAFKRQ